MILANQPLIFGNDIVVGLSSVDDGNMKFSVNDDDDEVRENRTVFLRQIDIEPTQTTLVKMSYQDTTDFTRYYVVDDENLGEGMLVSDTTFIADALVATRPDHALFLPLADCVGAVTYDSQSKILMVSHLGRHNVEQEGAFMSVQYLIEEFGSVPADLKIWLSPAVGSDSYPLRAFNNRSLHDVICEQLERAGVGLEQIELSDVDTADNDNYFSHSEYLAGNQMTDGRFAIVAMMRD